MRPFRALRRAPALAGIALLASSVTGGVASATTAPSPPSGSTVDDAGIPGGEVPDVLTQGTWFDDEGRLYFPEATSQSAEKDAAFCSFVFGTPDEVADLLGLDELAWAVDSGLVNLGGGGTGYSCGLVPADSDDALVTTSSDMSDDSAVPAAESSSVTTGDTGPGDDDSQTDDSGSEDEVRPLVVFVLLSAPLEVDGTPEAYAEFFRLDGSDGEHYGALALSTEYDGEPIDAELAEAWLTTARDRLA